MKKSLEQIEGVWLEPDPKTLTGLIRRCHDARKKPIDQLTMLELSTFLDQKIGVPHILAEAEERLSQNRLDDTEYYEGQLQEKVETARKTQQHAGGVRSLRSRPTA